MGRPPKYGPVAQTDAARQQRSRANRKGAPPTIDAATVQQCFRDAIGKSRLWVPEFDVCSQLSGLISSMKFLTLWPTMSADLRVPSWGLFVRFLAQLADVQWQGMSISLKADAPICVFVHGVMKHLGFSTTTSTISAVLRGRRGRFPRLEFSLGHAVRREGDTI